MNNNDTTQEVFTRSDRDLLIRLDQKVDGIMKSVDALTNDHEQRLRSLEKWVWRAIGGLTIINGGIALYISIK